MSSSSSPTCLSAFTSGVSSHPGLFVTGLVAGAAIAHTVGRVTGGWCPFAQVKKGKGCPFSGRICSSPAAAPKKPLVVTVTGAAGQIGYAILFQIAAGKMLGLDQPVELRLLEITPALPLLTGVVMELDDCAFPLLTKVVATDDNQVAFQDCDVALLIGARPRGPGMTRADLLRANAHIFTTQGRALNEFAKRTVKVLVVGNPANTNAKIAMDQAPDLPRTAFTAMTRLDEIRASAQLAHKAGVSVGCVSNIVVWGNHSDTQVPDLTFATVKRGEEKVSAMQAIGGDDKWAQGEFIQTVQKRGGAIIDAMKKSSAASAANAAMEHVNSWVLGTKPGQWVSMAVCSNGEYGVPKGLIFSYPCTCANGAYTIVPDLDIAEFAKAKLQTSWEQLQQEDAGWREEPAAAAPAGAGNKQRKGTK